MSAQELGPLKELDEFFKKRGFAKDHPHRLILIRMAEIDSDISKSEYRPVGDNEDRPPEGDDYNLLWDAILDELKAPFEEMRPALQPFEVYYKAPSEYVTTVMARDEKDAQDRFLKMFEGEEIIRVIKL